MRRRQHRGSGGLALAVLAVAAVLAAAPAIADAAPRRDAAALAELIDRLREAEEAVVAAERAAAKDPAPSSADLAKRLVAGQLKLAEGDHEGAAIVFLDLVENHADSRAAPTAQFFLGEALAQLGMHQWAAEMFSRTLSDTRPAATRLRQRAVARLFDLTIPRRSPGFAEQPGISAMPEVRARLTAVGVDTRSEPPTGKIAREDADRLVKWAQSFPPRTREPELRYSFGRFLFLSERHAEAQAELDEISPLDIPMTRGGTGAQWRVRAAYVAAAATLGMGDTDAALERFGRITQARPTDPRDRRIVELSWMAIGRIHHDADETDDAVAAYRRIGRDSPFFVEAMYETAWTLLRAEHYDQAVAALELLLVYAADSPIVPEVKQLLGKVRIQQRDYEGAEEQFLALRREFDRLTRRVGRKLEAHGNATAYFAAVIGEDMEQFSIDSLLPVAAADVARTLPRAVHGESLAREVGALDRELTDVRAMLAQMEEAVRVDDKARLFTDLAAHIASLDNVDADLVEIQEALVDRVAVQTKGTGVAALESQRLELRARLDEPLGARGERTAEDVAALVELEQRAHKLELSVGEMRAQLVAAERYYDETRAEQKIDHQAFLVQATELRDTIGELERQTHGLRTRISRAKNTIRFSDPRVTARREAMTAYRAHLAKMYGALGKVADDPEADTVWKRVAALADRGAAARTALDRTAGSRLQAALAILVEERANLESYRAQLDDVRGRTRDAVSETMGAAYRDVVGELANLVLRSEVGLLDVAWGMKEAEAEQVHRLEVELDRDLGELERAVDLGMEDLQP